MRSAKARTLPPPLGILRSGTAILFPGLRSRPAAVVDAGRTSTVAMGGKVIMLAVARVLEGIGRQLITDDGLRFLIGAAALAGWLVYFFLLHNGWKGE